MREEIIYSIPAIFRDDFRIKGYYFGSGRRALCVVGSVRGNEYQQLYTCGRLIAKLKKLESDGRIAKDKEILVIPCLNPSSVNIEKRFWPTDNTDINRMFPGYNLGETTQRIAAGVFDIISKYDNGIQLASFYMPGKFCPHVRIMNTGRQYMDKAKQFGLPYIIIRDPRPYDTTTLNYNWQIWDTDAFSLYGTSTETLDSDSADYMTESMLRFMESNELITGDYDSQAEEPQLLQARKMRASDGGVGAEKGIQVRVYRDNELVSVRPAKSGIYEPSVEVGEHVNAGTLLARIIDTYQGCVIEELRAPQQGTVFFEHSKPIVYANTAAIKLLPE